MDKDIMMMIAAAVTILVIISVTYYLRFTS